MRCYTYCVSDSKSQSFIMGGTYKLLYIGIRRSYEFCGRKRINIGLDTRSHVSQASLKHTRELRITLYFWLSCIYHPRILRFPKRATWSMVLVTASKDSCVLGVFSTVCRLGSVTRVDWIGHD